METQTNEFDDIEVFTGEPPSTQDMQLQTHVQAPSAVVTVEQQRAIAETQASMIIARMNPRDEHSAYLKIINACKRKSLAEQALYAYRRGGTLVTGESIRLAEVMARCWQNLSYGFRELSRTGDTSEVEAFCWDLETNTKATRTFQVKHFRDKAGRSQKLEQQRDIYEIMAGMAQRRVRSCIVAIIPGDIVEAAKRECDKTLAEGDGKPLEDRVRDMLLAFEDLGVSKEMIEMRLQHKLTAIVPQEIVELKKIYRSIRDGVAGRDEFFSLVGTFKKEPDLSPDKEPEAEWKCPHCDFIAQSERGLKKHITQQHAQSEHGGPLPQTEPPKQDMLYPEEKEAILNDVNDFNEEAEKAAKIRAIQDGYSDYLKDVQFQLNIAGYPLESLHLDMLQEVLDRCKDMAGETGEKF